MSYCLLLKTFNKTTSRCLGNEPALLLGKTEDGTRENDGIRAHVISSINLISCVITLVLVQRHLIEKRLIKKKNANNLSKKSFVHFYFEIPFSTPNLAFKEVSYEFSQQRGILLRMRQESFFGAFGAISIFSARFCRFSTERSTPFCDTFWKGMKEYDKFTTISNSVDTRGVCWLFG